MIRDEMKRITKLAIPVALAHFLTAAAGFVDTAMAGHASVADLAGVALGSAMWLSLVIAPMGLLMAVNPIVGQYAGAKNHKAIINFMHQGTRLAFLLAFVLILIINLRDWYLPLIIDDKAVVRVTSGYLQGFAWGVPALMATFLLRPYSEGLSFTKPDLVASLVSLVVNVPANYALIFGHWGAPALGGAGAGWATAIAFWAAFVTMFLFTMKHPAYLNANIWCAFRKIDYVELRHLFRVGIPIAMTMFVEVSIFSFIALFLGGRPSYEIAAHQVAMNVSYLLFTLPLSISVAATIRVSVNIGAGNWLQARSSATTAVLLALMTALMNIIILLLFADVIAQLYSSDKQVVELASHLLMFAAMFQLADAFVVPTQGALRGYKDTRIPMFLAVLAYWLVALPLGYLLGLTDFIFVASGAEGFWISLVVGLVISGILMTGRLVLISSRNR